MCLNHSEKCASNTLYHFSHDMTNDTVRQTILCDICDRAK